MDIELALFYRLWNAVMGILIFLTGLLHLCLNLNANDTFFIRGTQSNGFVFLILLAIFLMIAGIATIIFPFVGYIPVNFFGVISGYFGPKKLIAWYALMAFLTFFMVGWYGFVVALFCAISIGISVFAMFFCFVYTDNAPSDV